MAVRRTLEWSQRVSFLILSAAIVTPVGVAWRNAIENNYDSPPGPIHWVFLIGVFLLFAIFRPAVTIAVRHSPDLYTLGASTAIILGCVAGMYVWAFLFDSPSSLLVFPLAGAASAVGARAANAHIPRWSARRQL